MNVKFELTNTVNWAMNVNFGWKDKISFFLLTPFNWKFMQTNI